MSCYGFAHPKEHDDPIKWKISVNKFFLDDEVQKIFHEISNKISTDKKRTDKHKRYLFPVEFLYKTGGRIDKVLLIKPSDVNLDTNSIRVKTLKQGKDKNGIQREKYRVIPLNAELRDAYMQYLLDMNISTKSKDPLFPMSR